MIQSNTTGEMSWTINKYVTYFIVTFRSITGVIGVYLDGVLYTSSVAGNNLTVTVNKYVNIVSVKQRTDEGYGLISYLEIFGTYIQ